MEASAMRACRRCLKTVLSGLVPRILHGVSGVWRDGSGRFPTWMAQPGAASWFRNDFDAVVNANVLAYLGDRPETRGAQRWVEALIERGYAGDALVQRKRVANPGV